MSYILEALKKAEAERNRGAVPDLHAQATSPAAAYESEAPRPLPPWVWLLAGTAIALLAMLAWRFSGSEPPAQVTSVPAAAPAAVTPTQTTPPAVPLPAPTAEPAPAPASPQDTASAPGSPAPPASAVVPDEPAPAQAKPKPKPTPARSATRAPAAEPSVPSGEATAARRAAPASPPPAAARVPSLAELPEDVRRQVPPISIGGAVYSSQPASRMVVVNGLVAREGDAVTADVMLERIGPKAAVFSVRGQRFEVPY